MISFHSEANTELKTNSISWEGIQEDLSKLSRSSFYEKYKDELSQAGLVVGIDEKNLENKILSPSEIRKSLTTIKEEFYSKGYGNWKKVKEISEEFESLYESSGGAYSVLQKRVNDLNLSVYRDQSISAAVKTVVNNSLSDLSRKIDHHHKVKSSLPTMAKMIAVLGSRYSLNHTQTSTAQNKSLIEKISSRSDLLVGLFGGGFLFASLLILISRKKKKKRLEERELQKQVGAIPGEGMHRTGVITVNGRGFIESMNIKASSLFKGQIQCGDQWDSFFQKNFFRGKKYLGVKGFYRYSQNSKVVFYLNGHMDKASQLRTIEVGQMPLRDFDQALSLMERSSVRVDSMELFDDVFSELLNLGQIQLSLDVFNLIHLGKGSDYLYLSEFEAKKYITHVIKVVDTFSRFKTQGDLARIDIDRQGSELLIRATFNHCSLSEDDLSKRVQFENTEQNINDILSSIQNLSQSYGSSLIVKNMTINGERKVELKFKIQDNSNFQSIHRVRNVGNDASA